MRKFISLIMATFVFLAMPVSVFAHNSENEHMGKALGHFKEHKRTIKGSVTAIGASTLTVKVKNGDLYTVAVDSSTKLEKPFKIALLLSDIHVNDNVQVKGSLSGTNIVASKILVTPQNTHVAEGRGTVTAVSGNVITVQTTTNGGLVSNISVKTDSGTQVTKANGSAGSTADITVGSKISVKGLWDEVLNVLNAIKIHLR